MGHEMSRYTPKPGAYRMTAAGPDAEMRPIARTASRARAARTAAPRTDVRHVTSQPRLGVHKPAAGPPNDQEGER
ncbi:hypothetical protein OG625_40165 (plasmid) [Streptomyces sp. NBC_01351]|uniref:hypothetical protein n=1 Tax=Streptomyces sp. NBC_01351 TaxID=2903833 RepID=UPI002E31D71C|nr:hypothetical protein [Streptomyces sp. NBC_01351]